MRRDAAVGAPATCDGGENRVVEPWVASLNILGKQISRLIVAYELPSIRWRAAYYGVDENRRTRICDAPEAGRIAVGERANDQLKPGPAAKRGLSGKQSSHNGHRRAAQQEPGWSCRGLAGPALVDMPLQLGRQRGIGPHQERELPDGAAEQPQRFCLGRFLCLEAKAAHDFCQSRSRSKIRSGLATAMVFLRLSRRLTTVDIDGAHCPSRVQGWIRNPATRSAAQW